MNRNRFVGTVSTAPQHSPGRLPDDPQRGTDYPLIRALKQRPRLIAGSTFVIDSPSETRICIAKFEEPTLITAYVGIDLLKNNQLQKQTGGSPVVMTDTSGPPGRELFMLGRIRLGCQGTNLDANFDIPAGQMVQIPVMAESLEITARFMGNTELYKTVDGGGQGVYYGAVDPAPLGVAPTPDGPAFPVAVSGFIGQDGPSTGNATRRFRILLKSAPPFSNVPVPNLATHWRFQGDPTDVSAVWSLAFATSPVGTILVPITNNNWYPVPTNSGTLNIALLAPHVGRYCEIEYKIGFDGLGV